MLEYTAADIPCSNVRLLGDTRYWYLISLQTDTWGALVTTWSRISMETENIKTEWTFFATYARFWAGIWFSSNSFDAQSGQSPREKTSTYCT